MIFIKKYIAAISLIVVLIIAYITGYLRPASLDMYMHLKTGEQIVKSGSIINSENVFAHHGIVETDQNQSVRATLNTQGLRYAWLFEVILYLFIALFGFESFHIFVGIFAAIQVGLVYFLFKNILKTDQIGTVLLTILFIVFNYTFFIGRPYIIAFAFFIAVLYLILNYVLHNKNNLWIILPITYLWSNIHPSAFMAVFICFSYSIIIYLNSVFSKKVNNLHKSKVLFFLSIGVFLCSILPPGGIDAYKFSLLHLKYGNMVSTLISEWKPLYNFREIFIFYLIVTIIVSLPILFYIKWKRFLEILWLFPLIMLNLAGFLSVRNVYFGYLSFTILLSWIYTQNNFIERDVKIKLFALGILICFIYNIFIVVKPPNYYPKQATEYISKTNLKGNMLNDLSYGGYLEYFLFPQHKVYMDARLDNFFCCELQDWVHLRDSTLISPSAANSVLTHILDKNHISYAVIVIKNNKSGIFISSLLYKNPLWGLVFQDDGSEVWVKNDGKNNTVFGTRKIVLSFASISRNGYQDFIDRTLHIAFKYPNSLKVIKYNNNVVAVYNPNHLSEDNEILLYSAETKSDGYYKIPFMNYGKVKQSLSITKKGYDARILTVQDGNNSQQVFVIKNLQRTIFVRSPLDNSIYPQDVLDLVESIYVPD